MVEIVLDSLRFLIEKDRMALHGWVILENHLHLAASSEDISKQIHDFKSYTARRIIDYLSDQGFSSILDQLRLNKKVHKIHQEFQLWQEGSHPIIMFNQEILNQKLDYIHYNPVRRGYVDDPAYWRYSSYHDYHGKAGLLPVEIIGL